MMRPAMTAETIARALGGRTVGGGGTARRPAHDDREPSLSIGEADDGKVLIRCHAGCDQVAVIEALRARGLWGDNGSHCLLGAVCRTEPAKRDKRADADRTRVALDIWHASNRPKGTPVETYLRSRGLTLPMPPKLRFHAGLRHPAGGVWPAMVALVTCGSDDSPVAIHRTFLDRDSSSKAPVEPQKMMLGPCRSGAVRLARAGNQLMIGEGIETCLAAIKRPAGRLGRRSPPPAFVRSISPKPSGT